jgi:Rps23 Pro-64 3,4-dihydroxylase Tpa1-like proline 4-hydroxylase
MSESKIFGDWVNNIEELKKEFTSNQPFPHIVIENFLTEDCIESVHQDFPEYNEKTWWKYENPVEVKYANDRVSSFSPSIKDVFKALSSSWFIDKMTNLTGIEDLESDPTLHGAGLHMHPRHGRLMMHLDYEKHPKLVDKQRRINIILYLSKDWDIKWNGATELWNYNMTQKISQSDVIFNNAIVFQTTEESWHGLPEKILCPEGVFRKSLAFYYISPQVNKKDDNKFGSDKSGYRKKAAFRLRPEDPKDPRVLHLLEIRPFRRITEQDMKEIYPDWKKEL